MDRLSDYVHFASGNQTNSLIGLNTKAFSGEVAAPVRAKKMRQNKD
jgi:hypothetical protein